MKKHVLPVAALALLAACGTTVSYTAHEAPPHKLYPRGAKTVEIFTTPHVPSQPYVIVGQLQSRPDSAFADKQLSAKLVTEIREEASRIGCDAVILQGGKQMIVKTAFGYPVVTAKYDAGCAVYSPPATAAR